MGKLVIKTPGKQTGEVNLRLGEMTIGRHTTCDIVLKDDKSVSGKHAMIKTVGTKSTIEDLNSTNGTFVENQRIKQHELRSGESIIIGDHVLVYRDVVVLDAPAYGGPSAGSSVTSNTSQERTRIIRAHAQLVVMEGKDKGRQVPLVKQETVIDNPGKNPARIYRGEDGYVLHAQLGPGEPRINNKPVPNGGQILESGDVIEVAGTKYQVFV
ncbi:signal peptide protein [Sulfuricaulis limicola]|uniref:Signal peptide protein n=1 Tax=Sulfuricaulis limicola TaxID=1620215 RepID=A0A1B4XG36_9GAMM|nr:FHA domain-containing protein [Sulfuricaulis limicola]BAV33737.1 signal peptide protein [Sulfuricaulis limicola]